MAEFVKPRTSEVVRLLQKVADAEGLRVERAVLLHLAGSRDIRSALTDLETLTAGGKEIGPVTEHLPHIPIRCYPARTGTYQ